MRYIRTKEGIKDYARKRKKMVVALFSTLTVERQKEILHNAGIEYTAKNGILHVSAIDFERAQGMVKRQHGGDSGMQKHEDQHIQVEFDNVEEIYDDTIKGTSTGSSGYIYLPKKWIDRKVKVLILEK